MPESEWSEDIADAPKKGVPIWVWGCGGCGLLTVVILLVVVGMGWSMVQDAKDPEIVWPKVDVILPFDERPDDYVAFGGEIFGKEGYVIVAESKGIAGVLFVLDGGNKAETDKIFSGENFSGDQFGIGGVKDPVAVKLQVDGREVNGVLFNAAEVSMPFGDFSQQNNDSLIMLVDLSRDDGKFCMLEIIDMQGKYAPTEEDAGVTQEDGQRLIDDFLEPFNPWD